MTVDWTKPIETVPCARNPVPVPCQCCTLDWDDTYHDVRICDVWYDPSDGRDEGETVWLCDIETGRFASLQGAVRNVQPATQDYPIRRPLHMYLGEDAS